MRPGHTRGQGGSTGDEEGRQEGATPADRCGWEGRVGVVGKLGRGLGVMDKNGPRGPGPAGVTSWQTSWSEPARPDRPPRPPRGCVRGPARPCQLDTPSWWDWEVGVAGEVQDRRGRRSDPEGAGRQRGQVGEDRGRPPNVAFHAAGGISASPGPGPRAAFYARSP